jgi:hypothetical protein
MKPYMTKILGFDALGATTLALPSAAWAHSTEATCGITIRRYFGFFEDQQLPAPTHVGYGLWAQVTYNL